MQSLNYNLRKVIVGITLLSIIELLVLIFVFNLDILVNIESICLQSIMIYFLLFLKKEDFILEKLFRLNIFLVFLLLTGVIGLCGSIYVTYGYMITNDITLLETGRLSYSETIFNLFFNEAQCMFNHQK